MKAGRSFAGLHSAIFAQIISEQGIPAVRAGLFGRLKQDQTGCHRFAERGRSFVLAFLQRRFVLQSYICIDFSAKLKGDAASLRSISLGRFLSF